jgi:hypothetical protein
MAEQGDLLEPVQEMSFSAQVIFGSGGRDIDGQGE